MKQEANARRSFLSNAVGQDTSTNTGRKERSLDGRTRIKFLLGGYDTMSKKDLILMLAHDMQNDMDARTDNIYVTDTEINVFSNI